MPVRLNQAEYRIRSDTTAFNPGTPVWVTTQNQATPLNWPEAATFRIRFSIQNTGNQASSTSPWSIWVSRNAGAYSQVTTTSTAVRLDPTASSDAGVITLTTPQLTNPGGTFLNGLATDDNNATSPLSLPGSRYTEFEFGMRLVLLGVNDNDTLDFQVRLNGVTTNTTYTITPRLTVYIDDGIGAAQGDAIATATGVAVRVAVGAAAGDAIAAATGNSPKPTIGAATGDATASATGTGFSLGRGASQGDAIAAAVGTEAIVHSGVGVAQGDAIALGVPVIPVFHESVGFAQGDANASALPGNAAVARAIGDASVQGYSSYRLPRAWHTQTRIGQRAPKVRTEITQ